MRKTAFTGTAILVLSLLLTACGGAGDDADSSDQMSQESSSSPMDEMASDEMNSEEMAMISRMGEFEGLNEKSVSGSVEVSETEIVLSEFSSDEGPDLHVYLTNGTQEADVEAGMEIERVAFDKANQTFTLNGVDAASYTTVVIHCDKAKAVFGAATLS